MKNKEVDTAVITKDTNVKIHFLKLYLFSQSDSN